MNEARTPEREDTARNPQADSRSAENPGSFSSGALRINLQRTAVPVEIAPEQRLLLDIVKNKVGTLAKTQALLWEANHPFANHDDLVEMVRLRVLDDFYDYNHHEKGPQALAVLFDLLFRCLDGCRRDHSRERALVTLLDFFELVLLESGARAECNGPPIGKALIRLQTWFRQNPRYSARGATRLKKLLERAIPAANVFHLRKLAVLYLLALKAGYDVWLAQDDLLAWFLAQRQALFAGRDYEPLFQTVSHACARRLRERIPPLFARAGEDPVWVISQALDFPNLAEFAQNCLKIAYELEGREDPQARIHEIHFFIRLLDLPALADRQETILRDLAYAVEKIRDREETVWVELLKRLFGLLREKEGGFETAVLDCTYTIGKEAYRSENPRLLKVFLDEVIASGFVFPDCRGVNLDWQVVVNPNHLKNIRNWLSLIRLNPARSRKLISALLVNLKLGGLFISDTDLFQKDIARLLSAPIQPTYHLIKALCRAFPVYFQEIGAEGELRETSTNVDEICNRQDILIHFLRKQCHVEGNNQIIDFMEKIADYWRAGDKKPLQGFLPPEVYEQIPERNPYREEMAPILEKILPPGGACSQGLLARNPCDTLAAVHEVLTVPEVARRKAELFLRLYRLLVKKYTLSHHEVLRDLGDSNFFPAEVLARLEESLRGPDPAPALELLLHDLFPLLKNNILSEGETVEQEEIYRKRHIAAGIPSVYGRYREKRFDSLGLTFRLESLAESLFEGLTARLNLDYITRSTLQRAHRILQIFAGALEADGIATQALISNLDLLRNALETPGFTIDQYLNVFQLIAHTVNDIIQTQYIAVHEANLRTVIPALARKKHPLPFQPPPGAGSEEIANQACEWFIRDHLAGSFAIQKLDLFVGKILAGLAEESWSLDRTTLTLLLSYDPDRCFASFQAMRPVLESQIYLGGKGYFLKRLKTLGYPVPPGFVITTEFFRCRKSIQAYPAAEADFLKRLRREIQRLGTLTGRTFGNPLKPLLLSARSGSTFSMPGMMSTFLNIGVNEEITRTLSRQPRFQWAAWDNFRRFLQCWGMSFGIPRDRFDELMNEAKRSYQARYKRDLLAEQMREVAFAYRQLVEDAGIEVPANPWDQLQTAVYHVLASWDSDKALLYRQALKIAEEWGTAVIVQQMVFGNLDRESGTGVVFTRNPKGTSSALSLYGDYTVCAQGEDVVSGLVETNPISEEQRRSEHLKAEKTLETEFPEVYRTLRKIAEELVYNTGFNHQEIEFTFEGPGPGNLYLLQTRNIAPSAAKSLRVFVPTARLQEEVLGTGIGVGGGALCGMAVHRREEIERLRREAPDNPLVLLRPDTVPDDIEMILKVEGILTARGGSTSHAAVTAYRLGKTCVVGCRDLRVNERDGVSVIQDKRIRSGDWVGIDGFSGFIYLGRHETMPAVETPA